jgi:hypothetical protein
MQKGIYTFDQYGYVSYEHKPLQSYHPSVALIFVRVVTGGTCRYLHANKHMSHASNSFNDHSSHAKYKDAYSDTDCMLIHTLLLSEKEKLFETVSNSLFLILLRNFRFASIFHSISIPRMTLITLNNFTLVPVIKKHISNTSKSSLQPIN